MKTFGKVRSEIYPDFDRLTFTSNHNFYLKGSCGDYTVDIYWYETPDKNLGMQFWDEYEGCKDECIEAMEKYLKKNNIVYTRTKDYILEIDLSKIDDPSSDTIRALSIYTFKVARLASDKLYCKYDNYQKYKSWGSIVDRLSESKKKEKKVNKFTENESTYKKLVNKLAQDSKDESERVENVDDLYEFAMEYVHYLDEFSDLQGTKIDKYDLFDDYWYALEG